MQPDMTRGETVTLPTRQITEAKLGFEVIEVTQWTLGLNYEVHRSVSGSLYLQHDSRESSWSFAGVVVASG